MNDIFSQFTAIPEVEWWLWFLICSIVFVGIIDGVFSKFFSKKD